MSTVLTKITYKDCSVRVIYFLIAIAMMSSCTSSKSITYFQNKDANTNTYNSTLAAIEQIPGRIQPDDLLAIIVSSLSDESNALFNSVNSATLQISSFPGAGGSSGQPLGFSVDQNGEVDLPLLGKVALAGMTLKEADRYLESRLSDYIKNPNVKTRLLNHKFTVLGEVSRPGIYNLLEKRTTIPDVIGIAGDLTAFGRRDNVMLIRTTNNKREVIKLDLTSRELLNSPYYFIENNDVVYIEPRSTRAASSDRVIQLAPIALSSLTVLAIIYNAFVK